MFTAARRPAARLAVPCRFAFYSEAGGVRRNAVTLSRGESSCACPRARLCVCVCVRRRGVWLLGNRSVGWLFRETDDCLCSDSCVCVFVCVFLCLKGHVHVRKPCSVLMLRARKVCALCRGKHVQPNVHVCVFVASSTTPTLVRARARVCHWRIASDL